MIGHGIKSGLDTPEKERSIEGGKEKTLKLGCCTLRNNPTCQEGFQWYKARTHDMPATSPCGPAGKKVEYPCLEKMSCRVAIEPPTIKDNFIRVLKGKCESSHQQLLDDVNNISRDTDICIGLHGKQIPQNI
ncbi:hypothetical protein TNCT_620161 [Trichonephila clavata]|uniref:Uncharacterized protein n=1 Tax=Trichonephila clavata TaxID=2740835 RepID=A0A8X6FE52_TRICU|nr:hypothetical protein TNCT_620161 [Trichonephila clavata]